MRRKEGERVAGGVGAGRRLLDAPRVPVAGSADFGLPQRRPRIYILAIHESEDCEPRLRKPPRPAITPVSHLLAAEKGEQDARPTKGRNTHAARNLRRALRRLKRQGAKPDREPWIIDVEISG
eukprot:8088407-Pyramimonas_sp.AAC.2